MLPVHRILRINAQLALHQVLMLPFDSILFWNELEVVHSVLEYLLWMIRLYWNDYFASPDVAGHLWDSALLQAVYFLLKIIGQNFSIRKFE